MQIQGSEVLFSTGKEMYANAGVIGIGPDLDVSGGWDQGFCSQDGYCEEYDESLTRKERIELAEYMIGLWIEFKKAAL